MNLIPASHWRASAKKRASQYNEFALQFALDTLLCSTLNVSLEGLYCLWHQPLTGDQVAQLEARFERYCRGEPLAYIIGETHFLGQTFKVTPDTLIPRSDSEILVEVVQKVLSKKLDQKLKVLELGVGSGALSLTLAAAQPYWDLFGMERSKPALKVACQNARFLGHTNVQMAQGDWRVHQWTPPFEIYRDEGRSTSPQYNSDLIFYDLIFSNPPYVAEQDFQWQNGSLRFEPKESLISTQAGLADLFFIIETAPLYLKPMGWLVLEHGDQQSDAVRKKFTQEHYSGIDTLKDYGGLPRVTLACWNV